MVVPRVPQTPKILRGRFNRGESRPFTFSDTRVRGGGHVMELGQNEENVKKIKKTKAYKELRDELLDQLARAGNIKRYFEDLVEDYMQLYVTKTLLQADIAERGVRVIYNNGGGQCGYKKNDSVEQVLKVNTQMLKILEALNITPEDDEPDDEDEL